MHLLNISRKISIFKPHTIVIDPISNLVNTGLLADVKSILIRLTDILQFRQITVLFTALHLQTAISEQTDEGISSLVDSWIMVKDIESGGERNRGMYILKSRGMKHSNQIREFVISKNGIDLIDIYLGPDGILTGSAREAQIVNEETGTALRTDALGRKDREIYRKKKILEAQISALNDEFESLQDELNKTYVEENLRKDIAEKNRIRSSQKRSNNSENGKSR